MSLRCTISLLLQVMSIMEDLYDICITGVMLLLRMFSVLKGSILLLNYYKLEFY